MKKKDTCCPIISSSVLNKRRESESIAVTRDDRSACAVVFDVGKRSEKVFWETVIVFRIQNLWYRKTERFYFVCIVCNSCVTFFFVVKTTMSMHFMLNASGCWPTNWSLWPLIGILIVLVVFVAFSISIEFVVMRTVYTRTHHHIATIAAPKRRETHSIRLATDSCVCLWLSII